MIKTRVIACTIAAALLADYRTSEFILEPEPDYDVVNLPGTDSDVGCTDDCLDPMEK